MFTTIDLGRVKASVRRHAPREFSDMGCDELLAGLNSLEVSLGAKPKDVPSVDQSTPPLRNAVNRLKVLGGGFAGTSSRAIRRRRKLHVVFMDLLEEDE